MSREVWSFWWRVVWLHEQIKFVERRSIALQMGSSHLKRNKATSRWTEHTGICDLKWRNLPQQTQICLIPHICVCFSHPRYSGLLFQPSDRRTQRHLKVTVTISVADACNCCCTPEPHSKKTTRCLSAKFEDQRLLFRALLHLHWGDQTEIINQIMMVVRKSSQNWSTNSTGCQFCS